MAGLVNIEALKGAGEAIGSLGTLLKDIRAAITGKSVLDPTKQAEIDAKLVEVASVAMNAQARINEVEAASTDKFTSRWRPACGWLCVTGLAWSIFIYPIWIWLTKLLAIPAPPDIDTAVLVSTLFGMLGLGAYRTYEKKQGVQNNH